ncbi:MAG: hypothetical protein WBN52_01205, partial [Eudoraea sp.]|uniref:hypothetical protein n=1 Tax=Eudoraea sp. TaxID=1979955 RepID=UPI003C73F267
MKSKYLLFITLLVALSAFRISAQEIAETKLLINILTDLQERYGYQFNYASETIENIIIPEPN